MQIENIQEIEKIINRFIDKIKDPYLIEEIYKLKTNWEFHLTEDDRFVKTAAAMQTPDEKYKIYFNKNFINKHIENEEELVFVFLHEFLHIVNGDLLRNLRYHWSSKKIKNLIFDIKINSCIIKNYIKNGYYFLKRFYSKTENVFNLLLTPFFEFDDLSDNSIYENGEKQELIIKKIVNKKFINEDIIKDKKELAKWYIDAWFKDVTISKLLERIDEILKIEKEIDEIILIGNHGFSNMPENYDEKQIKLDDFIEKDNKNEIINMVKRVLEEDGEKKIIDKVITTRRGIVPNLGRREIFLLNGGFYPFFFQNGIYDDAETYKNSHIYIDVSGSFEEELSFVYKLIETVKNYIGEPIYLFSDYVKEINFYELKKGVLKTSGGTNFDCIISHAIKNKFKKILVITDGIGLIRDPEVVKENELEVFVVLMREERESKTPWAEIAKKMWVLRKK